jgi:hypothetical protein
MNTVKRPKSFDPDLSSRTLEITANATSHGGFLELKAQLEESKRTLTTFMKTKEEMEARYQALTRVLRSEIDQLRGLTFSGEMPQHLQAPLPTHSLTYEDSRGEPKKERLEYVLSLSNQLRQSEGLLRKEAQLLKNEIHQIFEATSSQINSKLERTPIQSIPIHKSGTLRKTLQDSFWQLRDEMEELRESALKNSEASNDLLAEFVTKIQQATNSLFNRLATEFSGKLIEETKMRRKLHNQLLELKGNIRVFARIRPMLGHENASGTNACILQASDYELAIENGKSSGQKLFTFDRVFGSKSDNNEIFHELHELLVSSLDGYNVAIIAYGVTGSGKTYTMEGIYERLGIDLFLEKKTRERDGGWHYTFSLSVYEVYNESIFDLINLKNLNTSLVINPRTGFFHIPGVTRLDMNSSAELEEIVKEAAKNRSISSTNCNEQSSRSHLVTTISAGITTPNGKLLESKLTLVDLAGSERLEKTGATGNVAREGVFINKSLSALGDVINARITKQSHVPYRNSILTSALQECIAGESKTLVVLNLAPSLEFLEESVNSVMFATRLREVETIKTVRSPMKKQTGNI